MTEAGWYADPSGKDDVFRWWDGHAWTPWLNRERQAPAPPEVPKPEAPKPEAPKPEAPKPEAGTTPGTQRPALAVVIGILVVVLGIGALITVGALQGRETVTGPPVAPPPPLPSSSLDPNGPTYDKDTREADVGGLRATMPGEPFYVVTSTEEFVGVAKPARLAQALTQANFDGEQDWYAACGIGIVEPSLVVPGDIEKTGHRLWKTLGKNWYVDVPVQEKNVKETHAANKGIDVVTIQGDLHYKIKGLSSSYDRMSIVLVDLDDGRFAAWFGTRPNDAKKGLIDQYQHSLDSLKRTR